MFLHHLFRVLVAGLLCLSAAAATAQSFPSKPLRLAVRYPSGGCPT